MARGGKREGAGRKALPPTDKKQQVTVTVSPGTKERVAQLREHGVCLGREVDMLVDRLCCDHGIDDPR